MSLLSKAAKGIGKAAKAVYKPISKTGKEINRFWDNNKGAVLGTVLGGGMGLAGGAMFDYTEGQLNQMQKDSEAALRAYEQAAERERTRTTITDANSAGGSEEMRKKRKRSLLAAAGKEGGSGTLLGGGASGGKNKLGE